MASSITEVRMEASDRVAYVGIWPLSMGLKRIGALIILLIELIG